jgi:hypothetical protein
MKKFYNVLLVLAIPTAFLLLTSEIMSSGGSPGGRTGSPGDGGANCTACHSSTPINQEYWVFSSEMMINGYEPGQTYNVMVYGLDSDADKFGFEATAEDNSGNKVGTFDAGFTGMTQTINNSKAITHTALGTTPLADTGTVWFFSWTAPATNVGDITFYAAINAANGNNATSGDQIHLSQSTYPHSTVGVDDYLSRDDFSIFPNPSSGIIQIKNNPLKETEVSIVNLMGQIVYSREISENESKIDLSELEKGIYFVTIGRSTQRIILH